VTCLALLSAGGLSWSQQSPLRLAQWKQTSNHQARLVVENSRRGIYQLEFSTDLRGWSSVARTNRGAPGQFEFQCALTQPAGFFRVSQPPEIHFRFVGRPSVTNIEDVLEAAKLELEDIIATGTMEAFTNPSVYVGRSTLPVTEALAILTSNPVVEFAETNAVLFISALPNDPRFLDGALWGMYASTTTPPSSFGCGATSAWQDGFTGSHSTCVGIIDSGVQTDHPDLAANMWKNTWEIPGNGIDDDNNGFVDDVQGWDFLDNDPQGYDPGCHPHGTHVAGTIGAVGNNSLGVVGVNWDVTMIPVRVFGADGRGSARDAAKAIDYLTQLKMLHGINLVAINNSWGTYAYSKVLREAVLRAAKQNILTVAAAGNEGNNNDSWPVYPASFDTTQGTSTESASARDCVIAVTAIDSDGQVPWWANSGAQSVDLGAPGVQIWSTVPPSTYAVKTSDGHDWSGTSMATPHVTGTAALLAASVAGTSAADIRNAILSNTVPTPSLHGKASTGGRLSVAGALQALSEPPPTKPAPPSDLLASIVPVTGEVLLTWRDNSGNELGFRIERRTLNSPFQQISAVAAGHVSYTDVSALAGTHYVYRVVAYNAAGVSTPSNEVEIVAQGIVPPPPSEVVVTLTSKGNARVAWRDNSDNETGFEVERSIDGVRFSFLAAAPASPGATLRIIDDTVSPGQPYYYRVRAMRGAVPSEYSAVSLPINLTGLAAPTLKTPPCGDLGTRRAATFTWEPVNGATSYRFQLSVDSPGNILPGREAVVTSPTHAIPSDDMLRGYRQYYWRVRAEAPGLEGAWSDWCGFLTAPDEPVLLTPPCGDLGTRRAATFTWEPVNGATSYRFQLSVDSPGNLLPAREAVVTSPTHAIPSDDMLRGYRQYYWRVRAEAPGLEGAWSDWCGFLTAPDEPVLLTPPCGDQGTRRAATFTWAAVSGATSYRYQLSVDSPGDLVTNRETVLSTTTHVIPEENMLRGFRQYYWRVRAEAPGVNGAWSDWCAFLTAFDPPVLLTPEDGAIGARRSPTFTWEPVTGAARYLLQLSVDTPGNLVPDREVTVTGTTHTISSNDPLRASRQYYWRLRAETDQVQGAWSEWRPFFTRQ
jgi:subtilisin family serine protease